LDLKCPYTKKVAIGIKVFESVLSKPYPDDTVTAFFISFLKRITIIQRYEKQAKCGAHGLHEEVLII